MPRTYLALAGVGTASGRRLTIACAINGPSLPSPFPPSPALARARIVGSAL